MFKPLIPYVFHFITSSVISLFQWSTFYRFLFLLSCHLLGYFNGPLFLVILKDFILVVWIITSFLSCKHSLKKSGRAWRNIRDFKIHYGELLLRLLRLWGTRLTTPFPPQTSNRLRFRCTATGCSVSTCLLKNGYVRLNSTFIRQRLDQWQWFPSLVSIVRLPEIRFTSQLLLQRPACKCCNLNFNHKTK